MSLQQLKQDPNVEIRRFPDDVLQRLKVLAGEIVEEMANEDPEIREIYDSFRAFQVVGEEYQRNSEDAYLDTRN